MAGQIQTRTKPFYLSIQLTKVNCKGWLEVNHLAVDLSRSKEKENYLLIKINHSIILFTATNRLL